MIHLETLSGFLVIYKRVELGNNEKESAVLDS